MVAPQIALQIVAGGGDYFLTVLASKTRFAQSDYQPVDVAGLLQRN